MKLLTNQIRNDISMSNKEDCIDAGCDFFFPKPFIVDELMNKIKEYFVNV